MKFKLSLEISTSSSKSRSVKPMGLTLASVITNASDKSEVTSNYIYSWNICTKTYNFHHF